MMVKLPNNQYISTHSSLYIVVIKCTHLDDLYIYRAILWCQGAFSHTWQSSTDSMLIIAILDNVHPKILKIILIGT